MRVLSGMQPSGRLHLGNYFGSMLPNLQRSIDADESIFFIVDLHALTSIQDAAKLRILKYDALRDYLAIGFDPNITTIFFQSDVSAHTELLWILSTICPMGLMERAVSYKDKVAKGLNASVGLFTYPILMAADILLYDINQVPVGKDQQQHVEIARDLAIKFNNIYGDTLTVPEVVINEEVAVIPGIDGQKMSKSYNNTLPLFMNESEAKKIIMSIATDSREKDASKDPDTCTIYQIHKHFLSKQDAEKLSAEYKNGLPYGEAKKLLLTSYLEYFTKMNAKRGTFTDEYLHEVAMKGAMQASTNAKATMMRVKKAVGLL